MRKKNYLRSYQGALYSDLQMVNLDKHILGEMIPVKEKTDFYSALDGVTRHKIGSLWFKSLDDVYTIRINEMRSDSGEGAEFCVLCWGFYDGKHQSFTEDSFVIGIDQLKAKVREYVKAIDENRKFNALSLDEKIAWFRKTYTKPPQVLKQTSATQGTLN